MPSRATHQLQGVAEPARAVYPEGAQNSSECTDMQALIPVGTVITLVGVGALVWCIVIAMKARNAGLDDAALKARLQKVVVINMAAMGLSGIGLMCVVLGILLT